MFDQHIETQQRVAQALADHRAITHARCQRLELAARFVEARIRSTGHCEVSFTDHAVRLADALVKAAQE